MQGCSLPLCAVGRIVAIDYGNKRCGIAVTDPAKLIATGLDTVDASRILSWLGDYVKREPVEALVVGEPVRMNGVPSAVEADIQVFLRSVEKQFPEISIHRQDERFTSKLAMDTLLRGGASKKQRQQKELVDKVSATLILQSFLDRENG